MIVSLLYVNAVHVYNVAFIIIIDIGVINNMTCMRLIIVVLYPQSMEYILGTI